MRMRKKQKLWIALISIIPIALSIAIYGKAEAQQHRIEWLTRPCIKPLTDYDYTTCDVFEIAVDDTVISIPKGFVTDLASIPRALWPVLAPQYSGFVYPAILHDFLYRCPDEITRKYADDVLYSALLSEGVSRYTATKFWLGVRAFGGAHFQDMDNCNFKYVFEKPKIQMEVDND